LVAAEGFVDEYRLVVDERHVAGPGGGEQCHTSQQRDQRPRQGLWRFVQGIFHSESGRCVCASISSRRLYLASRSDCVIEPTLMQSAPHPTARSASQLSSVSPLRALTVTDQPASRASFSARAASVSVPIWLTFSSKAVAHFVSIARRMRGGFVQSRSSPRTSALPPIAAR